MSSFRMTHRNNTIEASLDGKSVTEPNVGGGLDGFVRSAMEAVKRLVHDEKPSETDDRLD
jgi:hypothetical protein